MPLDSSVGVGGLFHQELGLVWTESVKAGHLVEGRALSLVPRLGKQGAKVSLVRGHDLVLSIGHMP